MTRGRSKTPARVQVFYFEKPRPAPTRTIEEMVTAPGNPPLTERPPAPFADGEIPDWDEPTVRTTPPLPTTRPPRPSASRHATPPSRPSARRRGLRAPPGPAAPEDSASTQPQQRLGRRPAALSDRSVRTPRERLSSSADALEYHRRKLEALAARPGKAAEHLADLALFGHALFCEGRLREAQVVFEGLVAREPKEPSAYAMLGSLYFAQDDETRALALFEAALAIDPMDQAALVGRAEIRLQRGQPDLALCDLEAALASDPGGRDPFSERARALSVLAKTVARTQR